MTFIHVIAYFAGKKKLELLLPKELHFRCFCPFQVTQQLINFYSIYLVYFFE